MDSSKPPKAVLSFQDVSFQRILLTFNLSVVLFFTPDTDALADTSPGLSRFQVALNSYNSSEQLLLTRTTASWTRPFPPPRKSLLTSCPLTTITELQGVKAEEGVAGGARRKQTSTRELLPRTSHGSLLHPRLDHFRPTTKTNRRRIP